MIRVRGGVTLGTINRYGPVHHSSVGSEEDSDELNAKSAVQIQALWRGHMDRADCNQRRGRVKPMGYYTHTLGLTYASSARNTNQAISIRKQIYDLLEDPSSSRSAQVVSVAVVGAILASVLGFVFETVQTAKRSVPMAWLVLEMLCTAVFTTEYVFRLAVCDQAGLTYGGFVLQPMNMFDLAAVVPFYVEVVLSLAGVRIFSLGAFRVVRLIRVSRMLKLGRYASGMRLMGKAMTLSTQAISVLVFLIGMGVTVFSSAVFTVERLSCPARSDMNGDEVAKYEAECRIDYHLGISPTFGLCCNEDDSSLDFPSILAASWWSTVTMTSVGYGEVVPKTPLGKSVGVVAALVGLVLIALPVAIVGQKFQEVYESNDLEEARCRAAARMRVPGEVWSLVPASDVISRLRRLKVKEPGLRDVVSGLGDLLEEVWEQREQLSRERRVFLEKQDSIRGQMDEMLEGLSQALEPSAEVLPALD